MVGPESDQNANAKEKLKYKRQDIFFPFLVVQTSNDPLSVLETIDEAFSKVNKNVFRTNLSFELVLQFVKRERERERKKTQGETLFLMLY